MSGHRRTSPMTRRTHLDLIRDVLDHEVVDVDNVSCGMVDDIELAPGPDKVPRVAALLVGPGALESRMPALFALIVRRVAGRRVTRIAWSEVKRVDTTVVLRCTASSLGLDEAERKVTRWLKRIPGA